MTTLVRTTRSELTRLRRKSVMVGWLGLTALFTVMINVFVFQGAASGQGGTRGPGAEFPTAAELARADGLVGALGAAVTLLGVITLAFWAVATATDYSTGLIRLLVQAEPRRLRLLAGKLVALTGWTAIVATLAIVVTVIVAPGAARANDIPTELWSTDLVGTVIGAWVNTFLALCVWGVMGAVLALCFRSSAVAISLGVGYVLVFENLVHLVAERVGDWLPGSVLSALAGGGSAQIGYGTALALGAGYVLLGLGAAGLVFLRRDISD